MEHYDVAIFGAGLFGCYAALHLEREGWRVALVEREPELWKKASVVNQARMHVGYHYPRSISTSGLANEYLARFAADHRAYINDTFVHYYGIDRYGSLTDPEQFERFCRFIGIPCKPVSPPASIKTDRLEAVFETSEFSFDPFLLRDHYLDRIEKSGVDLLAGHTLVQADSDGDRWRLKARRCDGTHAHLTAASAINATYANINAINAMFGVPPIPAFHEIAEIALLNIPKLKGVGLTIMDGPFVSVMPYGRSSFHSLSSVPYTPHATSREDNPVFDCQALRSDCSPDAVRTCTTCRFRPSSNIRKMTKQLSHYVADDIGKYYHGSLFTVKTKLQSSFVDDARPTNIELKTTSPPFATIFSGKINSIYEIEEFSRQLGALITGANVQ